MKTIAIDGDGVLLDYNAAYAQAWERAFGAHPALKNPQAYWPIDRWAVERLTGARLEQFRAAFDEEFWSTIPAIPDALQACATLTAHGYELVCVTALDEKFSGARAKNLQRLGFPIARVITTGNVVTHRSPKAEVLEVLRPVAFVDDYAPYLIGVDSNIHLALIMRDAAGSPNTGDLTQAPHSKHTDLMDFATWWINNRLESQSGS